MCIIPGPVDSVSNTKLFVMPSLDKTRQFTVYSNSVDSPDENVMILPVPNLNSLQLHTIKYKKLFDHLHDSVIKHQTRAFEFSMYRSLSASAQFDSLPVFEHGSYLVSLAQTIEDLHRLNSSVFQLPPDIDTFFAKHYTREFGYLCCVLKPGEKTYEPLAYSHRLHSNGKLFVPTLHYHNHRGHVKTNDADWDHFIYSAGTLDLANQDYSSLKENAIKWEKMPAEFRYDKTFPIRCARIKGYYPNRDIAFALA